MSGCGFRRHGTGTRKRRRALRALPATSRQKFFECETQSHAAGTRPSRSPRSAKYLRTPVQSNGAHERIAVHPLRVRG